MRVSPSIVTTLAVCVLLGGCSSGLLNPKGRITLDGETLRGQKGEKLRVVFRHLDAQNQEMDSFIATIQPGSTFEVHGHHGKGIPPGKYRISVEITDKKGNNDRLKGAFGPQKSPIVREVTNDGEEIVLDVGKPPE